MEQGNGRGEQPEASPWTRGQRKSVTLYAVNGLHEDPNDWLGDLLPRFTETTGIEVDYREDHSRATVKRISEASDAPADVVITLPPFIQMAAKQGLLASYQPESAAHLRRHDPEGRFWLLMSDYPNLICHKPFGEGLAYSDLLKPQFRGKIQYSKPGWSGAGTALLLQVFKAFGGKAEGLEFLKQLQANCLAPSAHTQGLPDLVNVGSLLAANGDVQTNLPQCADKPNLEIVFPIAPDGKKYAFELSYFIALVNGAPNAEHGKALIDFLLGEEAQAKTSLIAYAPPARVDVFPADDIYRQLRTLLDGVEIWEPDWESVVQTLDADVADYERIVLGGVRAPGQAAVAGGSSDDVPLGLPVIT